MAKIDIKELILKILPLVLPAVLEAVPAEEIGKKVKEKIVEIAGPEVAVVICEVLAKLLEEISVGIRE